MAPASETVDWISAQDAVAAIRAEAPDCHPGKELANAAMKAGFGSRARMAVFIAMDGSGALAKREHAYDIPPEWWWPSVDVDRPRGLQVLNLTKGEGWAILEFDGGQQRVELVGISFRRIDVVAHFQLPSASSVQPHRPTRGFRDSDRRLVDRMRAWIIETGRGIPAAAAEFAADAEGAGTLESKAKRLERFYVGEATRDADAPQFS